MGQERQEAMSQWYVKSGGEVTGLKTTDLRSGSFLLWGNQSIASGLCKREQGGDLHF